MTRKREVFIANSELRSLEPKNYEEIVALRGAYEQRLAEILSEGVAEGEFEVVDIQVATFAILALLTGLTTWYRPAGGSPRRPSSPPTKSWCCRASPPAQHPAGSNQTCPLPDDGARVAGWSADEVPKRNL